MKGTTLEVRQLVKESILLPRVLKEIEYLRRLLRTAAAPHKEESMIKLNRAWKLAHQDLQQIRNRMNELGITIMQTEANERGIQYRYSYQSTVYTGTYAQNLFTRRINLRVNGYLERQGNSSTQNRPDYRW